MNREKLAQSLDDIALLLELKGENPFKTRAYKTGAEIIRNYDGDILSLAQAEELDGIKGIGKALQEKLTTLAQTGELPYLKELKGEFPPSLFELFTLSGLGPKKIKALYDELKVSSIAQLETACHNGSVAELKGFGSKSAEKILKAIEYKKSFLGLFRTGDVMALAQTLLERLRSHPSCLMAEIAGSYRRNKEILHDLDFLVATRAPSEMTDFLSRFEEVDQVLSCGETKASVILENGLQIDLRAVSVKEYPFALQYFSGSKEHNVELRHRALKQGLSLNEYGFSAQEAHSGALPIVETEADIYRALRLPWIPPELRENRGEYEAAEEGTLPHLIQLDHLRGCFHNHTTASDGQHSLEEMYEEAESLGMEYLGISDHSHSSFQANGLNAERLQSQIEEIQHFNHSHDGCHLFAGSEVDILKNGSLDYNDELLSQLDYCVASVHQAFSLSEKEMTARIIKAMENPHVTMIGHLTGRLLLKREPYALNIPKIIDCAAETHTVIELNCNPRRLDMDWRWWKTAKDKGVQCSINPDAHHRDHFQFLALGVRVARKGWLEKKDILNSLNLNEIKDFLSLPKEKRFH